jgi:flavin-dependent dehydrogenase
MNRTIKISGAGIAGLTAAINLAQNGFDVLIYEKGRDVGSRFNDDFQGLENWSTKEDILDILNNINIKTNFHYKAFNEADLINDLMEKYKIISPNRRTGVYMVQRGISNKCLDQYLKNQALDAGVHIQFNRRVEEREVDIVATGPRFASGIVYGIKGDVDCHDKVMIMLNDDSAPKGYVYMAIIDGKITLASVIMKNFGKAKNYFMDTVKKIENIYQIKIMNAKPFGGIGNYYLLNSYEADGRLLIGERAGFQDHLFGFGMRHAFLSGYFAAQSIIKNINYSLLVKRELIDTMKSSLVNRFFYEKLGNAGYRIFIKKWTNSSDPIEFLESLYRFNWYKRLIYFYLFPIRNIPSAPY